MHAILYIEDNIDNLQLVERALILQGYTFVAATRGLVGLERAVALQPALILLDINLPDIDGYEVARRLRADERVRHIPIIGVSANALPGDERKALAAGCDDYLTKPLGIRDLWDKIARWLATTPTA